MLHTLNKAWVDILANQMRCQNISSVLIVVNTPTEEALKSELLAAKWEAGQPNSMVESVSVEDIIGMSKANQHMITFDEILISHDLHDCYALNYLAHHCNQTLRNGNDHRHGDLFT